MGFWMCFVVLIPVIQLSSGIEITQVHERWIMRIRCCGVQYECVSILIDVLKLENLPERRRTYRLRSTSLFTIQLL